MKRILVAGAAGFTGEAVCDLLSENYEVVGIDLNPMPHLKESVEADLADFDPVNDVMTGVDGVVNCLMAPNETYERPELPVKWNVQGLANLLDAARLHDVKRFVHTSTTGIFTISRPEVVNAESYPISQGWYPITKMLQERLCLNFSEAYGMQIAVMRIAGGIVCGRTQMLKGEEPMSKEKFHVGWICRYDIADACRRALEYPDISYEIFHIGSTSEVMAVNDVQSLMDRLGWKPVYDFHEYR
ncbi:MAG: NAD(P)-dependent oxidoreductase [Planctomycetota bacterium]|jgi:nucleoside-diphosphate-sugar epimerase|nr:NAD(P)-dependent oxidoreductase [Planctomycetota bacterium]